MEYFYLILALLAGSAGLQAEQGKKQYTQEEKDLHCKVGTTAVVAGGAVGVASVWALINKVRPVVTDTAHALATTAKILASPRGAAGALLGLPYPNPNSSLPDSIEHGFPRRCNQDNMQQLLLQSTIAEVIPGAPMTADQLIAAAFHTNHRALERFEMRSQPSPIQQPSTATATLHISKHRLQRQLQALATSKNHHNDDDSISNLKNRIQEQLTSSRNEMIVIRLTKQERTLLGLR